MTGPANPLRSAIHEKRTVHRLFCIVTFVLANGVQCETTWDDQLEYAQIARWIATQPDRIHESHESAVAFVRSASEIPPLPQ